MTLIKLISLGSIGGIRELESSLGTILRTSSKAVLYSCVHYISSFVKGNLKYP